MCQAFCDALARAVMGALAVSVAVQALFSRFCEGRLPLVIGAPLAVALALAAFETWRSRPTLARVAFLLDRRAGTRDRLATALAFEDESGVFAVAAHAECEAWLRANFDGQRETPLTWPGALPWIAVPIISLLLLHLWPEAVATDAPAVALLKPDPAALHIAGELETMARRAEQKPPGEQSVELQKVAAALKRSASLLRSEAEGTGASKAVLRELSALEQFVREAREGHELETLGEALSKTDAGKAAGEALKKRDPEAPKKLEELGKRLVQSKNNEQTMKQLAQAMAQAAGQLGQNSELGTGAGQAAAAAKSGDAAGTGQALGKMGQALQSMQDSGGSGGGGGNAREMQGMISQLQEMKTGGAGASRLPEPGASGDGKQSKASGPLAIDQNPKGKGAGQQAFGVSGQNGKPGSEFDRGTKKTPFGALPPGISDAKGKAVQVAGIAGDGETIRALLATAPGAEPAQAAFKPVYDAAKAAAEDALAHEEIPVGSRLFVKRYFEAIRPR